LTDTDGLMSGNKQTTDATLQRFSGGKDIRRH